MSRTLASYRNTRALVLGASGFVGYWVARALAAQGAHLTCAVRSGEGAERLAREGLGNVVVRRDLEDLDAPRHCIPALRPMIIFNLAGYGVDRSERDASLARRMNHEMVERLALVASTLPDHGWAGLRLVHVGSALEYGTTGGVLAEDSPCAPTTLYGQTKLAGTEALYEVAQRTGLEACTARLFTVYGPGEHDGRLLPSILGASRDGATLQLTEGAQRRDFAYVEDVAEGLLRLGVSDVAAGDVVNLATGTMQTVRTFVETTAVDDTPTSSAILRMVAPW